MPRTSHEQKQYYKARIRSLLAMGHTMPLRAIQENLLGLYNLKLDLHYIGKLRDEIRHEQATRADRRSLNHALAVIEDTFEETNRIAWNIAASLITKPQERLTAIRTIQKSNIEFVNLLFDAGIFDRKMGTIEQKIKTSSLSEKKKLKVMKVFDGYDLVANGKNYSE